MGLKIKSVNDAEFLKFGRIVDGYNYKELLEVLENTTEKPSDGVIYVPSYDKIEATPAMKQMTDNVYGGMPIQIGYCNGTNTKLNCLEYHRDSEINIPADDVVFLLAQLSDVVDGKIDTSKVEAFYCPKYTAVELYATALHYAPCSAKKGAGFRVAVVLPKGTNTERPEINILNSEDERLFARNKWLIAHPDAPESKKGAFVGLTGYNTDICELLK